MCDIIEYLEKKYEKNLLEYQKLSNELDEVKAQSTISVKKSLTAVLRPFLFFK